MQDDITQMNWLLKSLGIGGAPVSSFTIEYVVQRGGYSMTSMGASNTEELIEMVMDNSKKSYPGKDVARIVFAPVVVGATRSCQLINHPRIP